MSEVTLEHCYLCGKPMSARRSADHVPPKQLFASAIRKANDLQLLTIPTHPDCNRAYQPDEDYFVHSLMPFANKTVAGRAVYEEILRKFRAGEKRGLTMAVLKEFEPRPSGLMLPGNKVIKRFKRKRIDRIAWKIVRGLYFHHHKIILPADMKVWVSLTPVSNGEQPPEHFSIFMEHSKEMHGKYPGIFSYRFEHFAEAEMSIHYWAILLWDSILLTVMFNDQASSPVQLPEIP